LEDFLGTIIPMTSKHRRTLIFAFLLYFTVALWCMALIFALNV